MPLTIGPTFTKNLLGFGETLRGSKKRWYALIKELFTTPLCWPFPRGVPEDGGAILVDEEYGQEILLDAHKQNFVTCLTVEKAGRKSLFLNTEMISGRTLKN